MLSLSLPAAGEALAEGQAPANAFTGAACEGNGPADVMARVGPLCVDTFEASLWDAPRGGAQIDATACGVDGNDCTHLFARSVRGVAPAASITWFQAQQACANAGKRLLTNAEWQMAAAGTPDPGLAEDGVTTCNTRIAGAVGATGSRSACRSNHGIHDMVGNVEEWVADWAPLNESCARPLAGSDDLNCLSGATPTGGASALIRGGSFLRGPDAGVFTVGSFSPPGSAVDSVGFRCARTR